MVAPAGGTTGRRAALARLGRLATRRRAAPADPRYEQPAVTSRNGNRPGDPTATNGRRPRPQPPEMIDPLLAPIEVPDEIDEIEDAAPSPGPDDFAATVAVDSVVAPPAEPIAPPTVEPVARPLVAPLAPPPPAPPIVDVPAPSPPADEPYEVEAVEPVPEASARRRQRIGPALPRYRRKPRVRKVSRVVRRVDAWSVFKISVIFYVVLYVILLVAGLLLWNLANTTGTVTNVEGFVRDLFGLKTFTFDGQKMFRASWVLGAFLVLAGTGLNVTLAVLFNLISDLVGGVRVTVLEEEVILHQRPVPLPESPPVAPVDEAAGAPASVVAPSAGL
jgi:hypothetical protein